MTNMKITLTQKCKHKSYGRFGQLNSKIWIMDPRMYFQSCCFVSLSLFLSLTISIHCKFYGEQILRYIRMHLCAFKIFYSLFYHRIYIYHEYAYFFIIYIYKNLIYFCSKLQTYLLIFLFNFY